MSTDGGSGGSSRIRAGRYRHRITIQHEGPATRDDNGQMIPSWPTFKNYSNVPAFVGDVGGSEQVRGEQVEARVTTIVELRYLPGITPKMRVKHGSRTLEIVHVTDPEGRQRQMFLQCSEVA